MSPEKPQGWRPLAASADMAKLEVEGIRRATEAGAPPMSRQVRRQIKRQIAKQTLTIAKQTYRKDKKRGNSAG